MKRFIFSGLSILLMSAAVASPLKAETARPKAISDNSTIEYAIAPFNLVYLAYQGHFKAAGIPSYGRLVTAYNAGTIEANDLIREAIRQNRLPAQMSNNISYINTVNAQLQGLNSGHSAR